MTVAFSQTFQQFEEVKKAALNALKEVFPVEGKLRKIVMEKAWAEDTADPTDYNSQMKSKMNESTWGIPVYAHLKLLDREGKVIDENPKLRLFTLPKPTQRHSYIVGGNEYQVSNQLRLKPGVYTIRKQNGELKTQVNLSRGKNFDIVFDENKGAFYIQKVAGGQANITLLPILEHLGISRAEIAKQWGERITSSNEAKADPKSVDKLESAFGLKRGQDLKGYLSGTQISPETTKAALGHAFEKVDGLLMLMSSKNLLDVHMGKTEATDRDSLEYKEIHGIDDFIKERLEKNSSQLSFRIKRSVDSIRKTKLSQIVSPTTFNNTLETFFTQDDKSNPPEQTNPLEMLSGTTRVTFMGAGGIGSTHAITDAMRQIHPSHFGLIDPVHTPSSDRIGVNLHIPLGAVKDGKDLRTKVISPKGKEVLLTPTEMRTKKIGFPDETGSPIVRAMVNGVIQEIPRKDVDYFIPSATNMFTWSTNLIPFLPSAQGNRAEMAAKMMEQAISLKNREAPLVQTKAPDGRTFEEHVGEQASVRAPADGVITSVADDRIVMKTAEGPKEINLYSNFILNRKSFISSYSVVKKGDKVKKGQLLAESNYTKNGVLALGTNLKTAYINYKGYNFDDGIVISEGAAQKLTSEHVYRKDLPIFENTVTGLDVFKSFYPTTISPPNLGKMDSNGVVKKGVKVQPGDVLIAALQKRVMGKEVALLSKVLSERPKDVSVVWTGEDEGIVLDTLITPKKITVIIKTEEAAKIGDKLAGRHGNKGVITKIIPDNEMPKTKTGPVDILMSPMGIISRINVSQTYESAAAKAAQKTGKPYVVENFNQGNNLQEVKKLLQKTGVDDKEEVFDGPTGKSLGQVHVGMPHILKLFKQSQANYSVRQGGPGHGYDANLQPLKAGGEEGAKSLDVLTMYSMLSHGARANLREMGAIKSTKNDEFWKALKSGEMLPPPQPAFAFDKFLTYLKGAGIDVKKQGTTMTLAPLTDTQVREMSNHEIKDPVFYRAKDFAPSKGGFFDPVKMGGFKGNKWGHIELAEPVINPTFETAVRKLTGLGKRFDDIMEGKVHLAPDGEFNKEGRGVTGGVAIEKLLKNINVDEEIKALTQKASRAKGATLDDANKKLRYLTALKTLNMRPEEAYIRKTVPVIPSQFRPIYPLPDGHMTTSDANMIYKNLGVINKMMEAPVMKLLDEKHKTEIRKDLYEHVQGVTGVTDLNIQGKPREGFISAIKGGEGGQPKEGYFISKLLSKRQDYVGRGTIIPEPTLGIDEMAMPEPMAWKLFEPFVVKELRNHGKTPVQALDEIKQKSPLARRALEIVMEKRHVMLNRAPSLHKFSIMAFKPKITDGKSIKIQPLVNKGFNADFDGDEQLTTILTFVPDSGISALDETICMSRLEESDMTARFREIVGLKDSAGDFYMFNLENFPHTDLIGTKEGKKGRIDFYKVPEGIKVLSYDPDSKKVSWKDVFGWSKHYQREIEIVTLRSGRQIVTDDDPRAVYGICAGELEPRRFTPNEAVNSKVLIPLMIRGENSLYGKKEIFEGVKLSHKLGHLIGSVVSNGWVETCNGSFTGRIFIACVSEPCGEFFLKTAKEVFNFPGKELRYIRDEGGDCTYGPSKKWGFLQDDAARLLYKMVGLGARNKHLPPFFLTANKDFRNGLFAGLMDHDGTICISHAKGKKAQLMASYSTASIRLAQELQWLAKSLGIRSRITTSKTPAGEPFWYVSFSNVDIKSWNGEGMLNEKKLLALNSSEVSCSDLAPSSAKSDVVPIHRETAAELRKRLGAPRNAPAEQKSTYVTISNAISDGYISRISALKILETFHSSLLEGLPHIESWRKVVENTDVTWDPVESFERTGIKEDGYDLTVPGYETFVNIEGVVLSNTMTVHVPITDEANEEARKMLPSRNLYQPGNKALMIIPSQEALLGLYYLSQTDAGRKRLASILGPKYPITMTLGKKNILGLLRAVAEGEPENYGTIIQKLKEEGERHVYDTGMTVGINDIPDFSPESKKIIAGAKKVIAASKDFASTNKDVQNVVDEFLKKKLEGKDNPLYDQVASGAKGSPSQLRSIMVSPLFVADQKGRVIPTPISKPYAAGLTTADYWMASYGVRKGMMDTAIQTSLPGAFSKDIMATTLDNVISKADCGTKDGIVIPVTSNEVIDRYTAGEQAGVPHNTLVDVRLATKLKSQGVNAIKVRSPLKCLAPKGTCAHCYGLDEHGHLPEIGENVGAKSGQTISEPLTQLIMNSKHTGGVAGTGASVGGYQRISQLLSLPKVLTGSAALAPVSGKITKIVKGIAGGFDAYIGDTKVHIPQGRKPLVEAGQHVEKGDVLSDGPIKPQELTELRGVEHAQNYLTDELHQTYKDQGVGINRKTFETVVRSLTNTTQVTKPPAGSNWLPGDVIPLTVANHYNQSLVEEIDAHDAVGMRLANGVGSLKVGHILTAQEANSLASNGVNTVTVAKEPLEHKPFVKGMQMLPIMKHDWMAALGYRNISKVLQEGASQGWKTDLESYHPVPPMAYAATFGQGKEGKY